MDFSDAVVSGVPLIVLIGGLVEFAKKFGLEGEAATALSGALGLVFGAAYQISTSGVPMEFAGWLSLVVYGAGMGVVTSGVYDVLK